VVFACMLANSSLLLLLRAFSAAMLMLVKKRYFMLYLGGDMAVYLLQKVLRGDFYYWMPVDGALGLFTSLVCRVVTKIITDFTGVVQFRHPGELGGLYWTANMFLALVGSFGSVWVHFELGGKGVERWLAWRIVGGLSGAWVFVFLVFLWWMKADYRGTFFSTKLGKTTTTDLFHSEDDSVKKRVLEMNKNQWRAIRADVKDWVVGNWDSWKEEKPEWFTDSWRAMVPVEWRGEAGRGSTRGGKIGPEVGSEAIT